MNLFRVLWLVTKFRLSRTSGAIFIIDVGGQSLVDYFQNICRAHLEEGLKAQELALQENVRKGNLPAMCTEFDIRQSKRELKTLRIEED